MAKLKRHPMARAWDKWDSKHERLYDAGNLGPIAAPNIYLRNRLQVAFEDGWTACAKMARKAQRSE